MTHLPARNVTTVTLRSPYLVLVGDVTDPLAAKTGFGLVRWRRDKVVGQLRFDGGVDLGVPDKTIEAACDAGARSLLIGVAPVGGVIPEAWWQYVEEAAVAGLDIVSGMHVKLANRSGLELLARRSGSRLVDVRVPPAVLPVGSGRRRSGRRLLTVGTDCAVGKKYTALALTEAMHAAGLAATFRATGQTGIMIAGEGIPLDAVVADFVSGAAELLSPANDSAHWDVIEGQGSLFHPGFAGVSLGLLHGSQPDAIVVCHDASRKVLGEARDFPTPALTECIDRHLEAGRLTNPDIRCVGISVNTSSLAGAERAKYLATLEEESGLPCIDPLVDSLDAVIDRIRQVSH